MTVFLHRTVIMTCRVQRPVTTDADNDWALQRPAAMEKARAAFAGVKGMDRLKLDNIQRSGTDRQHGDEDLVLIGGRQGSLEEGAERPHNYAFEARFWAQI